MKFISTGDIYEIFTYKLATYLSTSDVAGLQNALIYFVACVRLIRVSRVCSGIPESYRVRVSVSFWLYVAASYDIVMVLES